MKPACADENPYSLKKGEVVFFNSGGRAMTILALRHDESGDLVADLRWSGDGDCSACVPVFALKPAIYQSELSPGGAR